MLASSSRRSVIVDRLHASTLNTFANSIDQLVSIQRIEKKAHNETRFAQSERVNAKLKQTRMTKREWTKRVQFRIGTRSLSCQRSRVRLNHHRQQVNISMVGRFMNENSRNVAAVTEWIEFLFKLHWLWVYPSQMTGKRDNFSHQGEKQLTIIDRVGESVGGRYFDIFFGFSSWFQ